MQDPEEEKRAKSKRKSSRRKTPAKPKGSRKTAKAPEPEKMTGAEKVTAKLTPGGEKEAERTEERTAYSEVASTEPKTSEIGKGSGSSATGDRIVKGKTARVKMTTSKAGVRRGNEEPQPDTQDQGDPASFETTAQPINVGGRVGIKQAPNVENQNQVHDPTLTKSAPAGEERSPDAPNPGEITKPTSRGSATVKKKGPSSDNPAPRTDESIIGAWTCKFNPRRTDDVRSETEILEELESGKLIWPIHTHLSEAHDGQLVFIWRGGSGRRALMAVGRIFQIIETGDPSDYPSLSISILEIGPEDGIPEEEFLNAGLPKSAYILGRQSFIKLYESDVKILNDVATKYDMKPRSGFGFPDHLRSEEQTLDLESTYNETTRSLDDTPTAEDMLGRRPMAEAIAERLNLIWHRATEATSASMDPWTIHLNAPWGAGKTSFFNLLKEALTNPNVLPGREPWIIIEYNAWHHRHVDPAWWSLYQEVFRQGVSQIPDRPKQITLNEWSRRVWSGSKVYAFFVVVFIGLFLLILSDDAVATFLAQIVLGPEDGAVSTMQIWTSIGSLVGSILSAAGVAYTTLVGGTADHAKRFHSFTRDPQIKLRKNFRALIKDFDRPVLIFIDDIDRCDPSFVTDLLESLMTVLRSNRAFYLIAGDGFWINRCFENSYKDFKGLSRDPGRSLGHNFLEKVFQSTIILPSLNRKLKESFWRFLLGENEERQAFSMSGGDDMPIEKLQTERAEEVATEVEEMLLDIKVALEDYEKEETDEITERFLGRFHPLIESNPRAMKRLVNAYIMGAIRRTTELGGKLNIEAKCKLALWVIFTHRWPRVVDYVTRHRAEIATIIPWAKNCADVGPADWKKDLPEVLRQQQAMAEVLNGKYLKGDGPAVTIEVDDVEEFLGAAAPISAEK